jgi:hypothetical protein
MTTQLKIQIENLESLKGQLNYTNECLNQSDIKVWETKEFTNLKEDLVNEINETENLIETIKNL